MLYLIIAIAAMSGFMLTLKFFAAKGIKSSQAIIVNYVLASAIAIVSSRESISLEAIFANDWWYLAVIAGVLLFASMHLMALSTRLTGVAVTTISARAALIIPIIFAALFLHEPVNTWQAVGIALVIVSLIVIFYNKREKSATGSTGTMAMVLIPLSVFLILGIIPVCMKSAQYIILNTWDDYSAGVSLYQAMTYVTALICAILYYAVTEGREAFRFTWKSLLGGLCLGVFNFLSTFGIMYGLRALSTGVFYAAYNIGVVIVTALCGRAFFNEKLNGQKIAGISLAVVAIAVLMILGGRQ